MSPDLLATLLILTSAVFHAVSNALVKAGGDKLAIRAISMAMFALIALPVVFFVPLPTAPVWGLLIISGMVNMVYHVCVVNAYRYGDLSLVYPVMRGIAPVLTGLGAYLILAEDLSLFQFAGLVVLSLGIFAFALERGGTVTLIGLRGPALGFAAVSGVCIALYTLIDATGVRTVDVALTYVAWLFLLDGLIFPIGVAIWRRGTLEAAIKENARVGFYSGFLGVISYGLALYALRLGQTAEVAALRETSVVFAAMLGAVFMGEAFGKRRIAAAAVIAIGAIVLKVS
ncbi:MAG: DMT family transporter [Rhodospirillaceae bacterium]